MTPPSPTPLKIQFPFSNGKGQLTALKTLEGASGVRLVADALTEYNAYEAPYRTGLDLDTSPGLTPSSALDQINETDLIYEKDGSGAWWLKKATKVYNQPGNATPVATSIAKERLNKFASAGSNIQSESISIVMPDTFNNQTRTTAAVDRVNRLVTTTVDEPDSSVDSVSITRSGLLMREQTSVNLVMTHAYDSLGRRVCTTDPRIDGSALAQNLAPRVGFNDGSAPAGSRHQKAWTRDTAGNQTTFTYSATTGRLAAVKQPAVASQPGDKFTYYDYTLRGELYRQWGHISYPVEYGFNDYGDKVSMKTFRAGPASVWSQSTWPASPSAGDLTKWTVEPATGLLLEKYDAANLDFAGQPIASAKKVSYTYNMRGQVKTRTWARGVVTTYKYFGEDAGDPFAGELKSADYSDTSSTNPDISYTYDRLGRPGTIDDVTGQRALAYDSATTLLQTETLPTFFGSRVLTPKYDTTGAGTKGRDTGFSLGVTGTPASDYEVTYDYDSYGRSSTLIAGGVTFSYGYQPASNLIASIADAASGWTQTRTWLSNRNLLDKIETKFSSATKAAFDYDYDEVGRRTSVIQTGEIFSRYVGQGLVTPWAYNDRGELVSGNTYHGQSLSDLTYPVAGRSFGFEFDGIGNRTKSSIEDRETGYSSNSLNQIVSRTTPGKVEVSGFAPTASTVQANSQAVTRQGDYYHKAVEVSNANAAVHASVAVSSTSPATSVTRKIFLAKGTLATADNWQYDADGNLTRDDQWTYAWDAENRLLAMETRNDVIGSVVAAGDARRLEFAHDYLGRRVRKVVRSGWNGTSFAATPDVDSRFTYSGWNLIGEYNALSTLTLTRTFTWGLDLSGSMRGAGGVGGLLMSREGSTSYLYAFDGNGNVAAIVNRIGGAVVAEYEYSPFGEILRATGAYAQTNHFRFSTKFTDDETGLVYYGYRYYSPSIGRWFGRDPGNEQGGLNLYGFCGNNGINCWDLLGQEPFTINGKLYDVTPVPANLWTSASLAKLPAGTMWTATPLKWGVNVQIFYSTATGFGYYYSPFSYYYVAVPITPNSPATKTPPNPPTITAVPPAKPAAAIPISWNSFIALAGDAALNLVSGWSTIGAPQFSGPSDVTFQQIGVGIAITRNAIGDATGVDVNNPRFQLASLGVQFAFNAGVLSGISRFGQATGEFVGPVSQGTWFSRTIQDRPISDLTGMLNEQQSVLLRQFLGNGQDGAAAAYTNPQLPSGLTMESLRIYAEIAVQNILKNNDRSGVQAMRLMAIERFLQDGGGNALPPPQLAPPLTIQPPQ